MSQHFKRICAVYFFRCNSERNRIIYWRSRNIRTCKLGSSLTCLINIFVISYFSMYSSRSFVLFRRCLLDKLIFILVKEHIFCSSRLWLVLIAFWTVYLWITLVLNLIYVVIDKVQRAWYRNQKTCVSDMFAVPDLRKCISLGFFLAPDGFLFLFSKKENY